MTGPMTVQRRRLWAALICAALAGCGGGSDSSPPPAPPTPPAPLAPVVTLPPLIADTEIRISGDTPFAINCTGGRSEAPNIATPKSSLTQSSTQSTPRTSLQYGNKIVGPPDWPTDS